MKSVILVAILVAAFVAFGACDGEGANNMSSDTFSQAPFRIVDDGTENDLSITSQAIANLTNSLKTARNTTISASNSADEEFIKSLTAKEEKEETIAPVQRRAADPYEISILSKIQDKMNVIRDAAMRMKTAQQQQPEPANIAMLRNLVENVKQMRKAAEQRNAASHNFEQEHDMDKLRKEERIFEKMRDLAENRYVPDKSLQSEMGTYRQVLRNTIAH